MATVEKAEIKILTANNIGADLEDMLESARNGQQQAIGAESMATGLHRAVAGLVEHLQKDVEEGNLTDADFADMLTAQKTITRWIGRATGLIDNHRLMAQQDKVMAIGKIAAFEAAMKIPRKVIEQEKAKAQAVIEAMKEMKEAEDRGEEPMVPHPARRATGVHPGNPLAARRAQSEAPADEPDEAPKKTKKTTKGKGPRKCSACGEEGHNSRSKHCPAR